MNVLKKQNGKNQNSPFENKRLTEQERETWVYLVHPVQYLKHSALYIVGAQ